MKIETTDTYRPKNITTTIRKSSKSSTYSRSYQQCKNYMNIDQNLVVMTKKHNITNSSKKAQQEIKIARIAWTTTSGHIDHELFLMIMKHNIPNIAGWNDRHMSKQANKYHHHLLKQLKKLKYIKQKSRMQELLEPTPLEISIKSSFWWLGNTS